jgi:C1A family cysteine protease
MKPTTHKTAKHISYKPQPKDSRDYRHKAGLFTTLKQWVKPLPTAFELDGIGEIENQGLTNSCVGHAVSGALEILLKGGDLSRLAIYYWARWYTQTTGQDSGCYIRDALKGVNKFGVLPESRWPFAERDVLKQPPSYQTQTLPITFAAISLANAEQGIKQALCAGKPVVLAFQVPREMPPAAFKYRPEQLSNDWHAVLVYGYEPKGLLFKNSWGKDWGFMNNRGCGLLDWEYVRNGAVTDVTSVELTVSRSDGI